MKKTRIIERIFPNGQIRYVIQQPHFLFKLWWVDAWENSLSTDTVDDFNTFEEAKRNLWRFNGSKCKETVVYDSSSV